MKKLKLIIILFSFCQCIFHANAQSQTDLNLGKCKAIRTFLSSPKVDSNFSRYHTREVDTFFIVDLDSSLTKCNCTSWRGKPVKLITKGPLFDSVMRFNWPYLVVKRNQRSLYKFSMRQENRSKGIIFLQGYGSIISEADYIIKNRRYYINNITSSVE